MFKWTFCEQLYCKEAVLFVRVVCPMLHHNIMTIKHNYLCKLFDFFLSFVSLVCFFFLFFFKSLFYDKKRPVPVYDRRGYKKADTHKNFITIVRHVVEHRGRWALPFIGSGGTRWRTRQWLQGSISLCLISAEALLAWGWSRRLEIGPLCDTLC